MSHLLVTNDFPPKVGGIQSYLGELWSRLPAGEATVLTTAFEGADGWDRCQPFPVRRSRRRSFLPGPGMVREIVDTIVAVKPQLVLYDPAWPLGAVGPMIERRTGIPYGVVLHGAEVAVPGRVGMLRPPLARTLKGAAVTVCAGGYPAAEAERAAGTRLPTVIVPPGVDTARFRPTLEHPGLRLAARERFALGPTAEVVVGVSRLVPRKGFDCVVRAAAMLAPRRPELVVLLGGTGRDRDRLESLARDLRAPVRFLGRVDDADLPLLYQAADVFAMICRDRWGGLEQEGFGIVFLEAAATGVPQVAGRSGGAHEAVDHERTGLVVADPRSVPQAAACIDRLLADGGARAAYGVAGRARAVAEFGYDSLALRLLDGLRAAENRC